MKNIILKVKGSYNSYLEENEVKTYNYNEKNIKEDVIENISYEYDIDIELNEIINVEYITHYNDNYIEDMVIVDLNLEIEIEFETLTMRQLKILYYCMKDGYEIEFDGINITHGRFKDISIYDVKCGKCWNGDRIMYKEFDKIDEDTLRHMNKLLTLNGGE